MTNFAIIHSADSPFRKDFLGDAGWLTHYKPCIFSIDRRSRDRFSPFPVQVDPKQKKLRKGLRSRQFQLLMAGADRAGFKALSWKSQWQVPLVASLDGYERPPSETMRKNKKRLKRLFSLANGIFVSSEALKEKWINQGCPEEKLIVHYRGIDLRKIDYLPRAFPYEGPLIILYAGKLVERNGGRYLLEAFQKVHEKFPLTQLRLIGDGEWKGRLKSLARKLHIDKAVHFLGDLPQHQIRQELARAHLFCLPCVTDRKGSKCGIPDALKAAMASGLPVVSTNHSGIPELITDGVNGYLVPEKNSHFLAKKVIRLIEQPYTWERFGLSAREKIEDNFNLEKQARQLEQWFDRVSWEYQERRKRPLFSVIIPAYNRERYIGKAIRSVLKQTCDDYELIVVDDGSTDRTKKVVKSFGDRVRYIYQKNRGPSAARNTGILQAKGKYIAFLDSDDRFYPNKLKANKQFLEKHPKCKFLYSWYHDKRDGERKRKLQRTKGNKKLQKFRLRLYQRAFTIRTSTAVIHRSCFDKVGLFRKKYRTTQDWDMWIRLAKYFLGYCQKVPLVQYRRHKRVKSATRTRRYHRQIRKTARRLYSWNSKKLKRLEKKYGRKTRVKTRRYRIRRHKTRYRIRRHRIRSYRTRRRFAYSRLRRRLKRR